MRDLLKDDADDYAEMPIYSVLCNVQCMFLSQLNDISFYICSIVANAAAIFSVNYRLMLHAVKLGTVN